MPVEVLVFIGGTGPEGLGLAVRFAAAGHEIVIGSRSLERAQQAVEKIRARVPGARKPDGRGSGRERSEVGA